MRRTSAPALSLVAPALATLLTLGSAALAAQEHGHVSHGGHGALAAPPPAAAPAVVETLPSPPLPADVRYGEAVPVGNGTARTLVAVDTSGKPRVLGVSLSADALDGLQAEPPADDVGWLYRLPLSAGLVLPPFDHVGLYWNPHGHEPHGVYTVGHFDVHFFMSAPQDLDRITVMDRDLERAYRLPPASAIPAGYLLPPNTQHRRMGVHWVDSGAGELHGAPFTATFIIGSYDQQVNFLEPMITRAFLATKPRLTRSVPQPAAYARAGWYPATWTVRWDEQRREYLVLLEGLQWQKATLPGTSLAETAAASTADGR